MLIDKVTLKDFRIYQGVNELSFLHHQDKNVTIVAGDNGYGKTTFLTSLVWCLYGKLMSDVDERFRKEIYESGGYKRFCQKIINRATWLSPEKDKLVEKLNSASGRHKSQLEIELDSINSFSVSIRISDIFIPSVPCNRIDITRSFNVDKEEESVEVLIDGRVNELTNEVGSEIFIHDFIIPKEIAKFFFFDAEKIVSLAEVRTTDEKRELSKAYTEVLGIKKYEDLKRNLDNIRFRLRSGDTGNDDKNQLDKLFKQISECEKLQEYYHDSIELKREELARKREESERLQEKLIREGSSVTISELNDLKLLKENASIEFRNANQQFKEFLELAPFAIGSKKLGEVKKYLLHEEEDNATGLSTEFFKTKLKSIEKSINQKEKGLDLSVENRKKILEILSAELIPSGDGEFKPLLDFTAEQVNQFRALFNKIQSSYADRFKALVKEIKIKQSSVSILVSKLTDAETKENDKVIQAIRADKQRLDGDIKSLEEEIIKFSVKLETEINNYKNLNRRRSELSKKVEIAATDIKKDEVAARLITKLSEFLRRLKEKKKESLESKILTELQRLMHKQRFIAKVDVILEEDMLDIDFYDDQGLLISKDGLSKGEQQLYATALLKALVDESNIRFPIFIDSPLQKFDHQHASNIIKDFYPNVSEQVILLPLLEKELTRNEYQLLYPRVSKTYIIKNQSKDHSSFKECRPSELFESIQVESHV